MKINSGMMRLEPAMGIEGKESLTNMAISRYGNRRNESDVDLHAYFHHQYFFQIKKIRGLSILAS